MLVAANLGGTSNSFGFYAAAVGVAFHQRNAGQYASIARYVVATALFGRGIAGVIGGSRLRWPQLGDDLGPPHLRQQHDAKFTLSLL
jgi:hypothetical protein